MSWIVVRSQWNEAHNTPDKAPVTQQIQSVIATVEETLPLHFPDLHKLHTRVWNRAPPRTPRVCCSHMHIHRHVHVVAGTLPHLRNTLRGLGACFHAAGQHCRKLKSQIYISSLMSPGLQNLIASWAIYKLCLMSEFVISCTMMFHDYLCTLIYIWKEGNQKNFAIHFILMLDKFLFSNSLIHQIDIRHLKQAGLGVRGWGKICKWGGENHCWGRLSSSCKDSGS